MCIAKADLSPRSPLTAFRDFIRPPTEAVRLWNDFRMGYQYPFISGSTFRMVADEVQGGQPRDSLSQGCIRD